MTTSSVSSSASASALANWWSSNNNNNKDDDDDDELLLLLHSNDHGYFLLKDQPPNDDNDNNNNVLLLHSTEVLLKLLNPGKDLNSILLLQLLDNDDDDHDEDMTSGDNNNNNDNDDQESTPVDTPIMDTPEQQDDDDEAKNNKNKTKKSSEQQQQQQDYYYEEYQSLQRVLDLSGRIQAAIHDIQQCRNRFKPNNANNNNGKDGISQPILTKDNDDDDEAQPLEGPQDDSEMEEDNDNDEESSSAGSQDEEIIMMDQDGKVDEEHDDDGDDDDDYENNNDGNKTHDDDDDDETELVRMVRTLNSIRALFPHLIAILNHPHRNDKNLKIQKVAYKKRNKRKAMCWILGKHVFDTTTVHWCKTMHRDITIILKGYMNVSLVEKIMMMTMVSSSSSSDRPLEFCWQTQWIPELQKRMTPKIMRSPLDVLLLLNEETNNNNNVSNNGSEDRILLLKNAQKCDQDLFATTDEHENNKATFETRRKYRQCIDNLRDNLLKALKKRFPKARLTMYGSCLSNLSLGGSDVDLSLWIPEAQTLREKRSTGNNIIMDPEKYQREMKNLVFKVFYVLKNRDGFQNMQPITRARVPVVKGTKLRAGNPHSPDGSIDFDICFLNDIAVTNSNLLREYSLVDSRVRDFMLQVKRFCRHYAVNSSPNGTISSYAWNIMCIFYLQCINFIPNLQDPNLMEKVKQKPNPKGNYWHLVDGLDTFYLKWKDVEKVWERPAIFDSTTVSLLLYGFFEFYNHRFAYGFHTISIRHGSLTLSKLYGRASPKNNNPKLGSRLSALSIEDPFENYESHRPHDLGSHSYNDDKILKCLMDGEKNLRKLLMHGATQNPGAAWKRSTANNGGEGQQGANNNKKPAATATNKLKGDKKAAARKKAPNNNNNGHQKKQGGQGKQRNNNNGRNNNKSRQTKPPNQPTENNDNNNNNNNINPKGRKRGPQQKRKNGPRGGPKKSQEKGGTNNNNGNNNQKH